MSSFFSTKGMHTWKGIHWKKCHSTEGFQQLKTSYSVQCCWWKKDNDRKIVRAELMRISVVPLYCASLFTVSETVEWWLVFLLPTRKIEKRRNQSRSVYFLVHSASYWIGGNPAVIHVIQNKGIWTRQQQKIILAEEKLEKGKVTLDHLPFYWIMPSDVWDCLQWP